jgi:hypothetical protein
MIIWNADDYITCSEFLYARFWKVDLAEKSIQRVVVSLGLGSVG